MKVGVIPFLRNDPTFIVTGGGALASVHQTGLRGGSAYLSTLPQGDGGGELDSRASLPDIKVH